MPEKRGSRQLGICPHWLRDHIPITGNGSSSVIWHKEISSGVSRRLQWEPNQGSWRQKNLTQQLIKHVSDAQTDGVTARSVSWEFRYDDGEQPGKHTKDHAQGLSERSVEWLFMQADDVFEGSFDEKTQKTFWTVKSSEETK